MDNKELNIKKYPKSKNNLQCLGPCYYPGTTVIHPTLLEFVTDKEKAFCPVSEWEVVDPATGQRKKVYSDVCFNPTDKTGVSSKELELNILTPYIDFSSEQFLKIYYEIFSFEDALDWLGRNKDLPIDTQIRVMECALKAFSYGRGVILIDVRFVDFIIDIIKRRYISFILQKNGKYVGVNSKDEFMLVPSGSVLSDKNNSVVEKTNYLVKMFVNRDEITKFIGRYFKLHSDTWDSHKEFIEPMMKDFSEYVNAKIQMTLKREE